MRSVADMDGEIVCASCTEPLERNSAGEWSHVDASCGFACADARGDRKIIPLRVEVAFRPIPYDPMRAMRAREEAEQ